MRITGFCPACGSTALDTRVASHGATEIYCRRADCPDPGAASKILADPEIEHVIEFGITGFTVRHPLRERIADDLFNCEVHQDHSRMGYRPVATNGRYRAFKVEGTPYGYGYVLLSDDVAE